jgi:hypothetical protein
MQRVMLETVRCSCGLLLHISKRLVFALTLRSRVSESAQLIDVRRANAEKAQILFFQFGDSANQSQRGFLPPIECHPQSLTWSWTSDQELGRAVTEPTPVLCYFCARSSTNYRFCRFYSIVLSISYVRSMCARSSNPPPATNVFRSSPETWVTERT